MKKYLPYAICSLLTAGFIDCSNPPASAPTITGINQKFGPTTVSKPEYRPTLTLTGQNFSQGAKVKIEQMTADKKLISHDGESVVVTSDTQLQFILPESPGLSGKATIRVINADGRDASRDDLFSYYLGTMKLMPKLDSTKLSGTPLSFVAADFDHDGANAKDLAMVYRGNFAVDILSGDNQGGFSKNMALSFSTGTATIGHLYITAADIDNDSLQDLVFLDDNTTSTMVNIGTQDQGGFTLHKVDVTTNPRFVVVGDFDGDKNLDLATANTDPTNRISIAINNQKNLMKFGFLPPIKVPLADDPTLLLAKDLDVDGSVDLIALTVTNPAAYVLRNSGVNKADFSSAPQTFMFDPGVSPQTAISSVLFDGNFPDVVLISADAMKRSLSILQNVSMPTMLTLTKASMDFKVNGTSAGSPSNVAAADFDRDGFYDLAVMTGNEIDIFLSRAREGHGVDFQPAIPFVLNATELTGILVDDFNADGLPDVIATSSGQNLTVFLNTSN